jgi:hypothetical protein
LNRNDSGIAQAVGFYCILSSTMMQVAQSGQVVSGEWRMEGGFFPIRYSPFADSRDLQSLSACGFAASSLQKIFHNITYANQAD